MEFLRDALDDTPKYSMIAAGARRWGARRWGAGAGARR